MDIVKVSKALSNETRLSILRWLRDPGKNFRPQGRCLTTPADLKGGVCVNSIQEKTGLSQSTVSSYLAMLQEAGLLISERHEKWTYYRRNEETIRELAEFFSKEI